MLSNGNILCGCLDGRCCLFDSRMGSKNLVTNFMGHSAQVQCLDLNPFNSSFIAGSDDRTINLYDLRANVPLQTYSVTASKPARLLRNFGESRKKLQLFDQDDNIYEVTDCCFTQTGRLFMSGIRYGNVLVWDLFNHSQPILNANFPGSIRKIQMNSKRDKMAVVCWSTDNSVDIYEPFIERR